MSNGAFSDNYQTTVEALQSAQMGPHLGIFEISMMIA